MKNTSKRNLIFIIISCLTFTNCRDLPDDIDSKLSSMLIKLPSQSERGNISLRDGRLLYDLIIQNGYKHGLEIGTSNGYSALWQGLAFSKTNGKLLTIEIDSVAGREAQNNFVKAGLDNLIYLKIDDAKKVLETIDNEFDFVFVDTGDSSLDFFTLTHRLVCNGGTIVIHNVNKKDPSLKAILNNPQLDSNIRSRLFYSILICTKKK